MPVSDFMTVFFVIIKKSTLFSGRKGGFRQIAVDEKIAEKVGFLEDFLFLRNCGARFGERNPKNFKYYYKRRKLLTIWGIIAIILL